MADMQIVPACKNVEAQYVEMMVPLYSHGCEKKIEKTLSHLKGKLHISIRKYLVCITKRHYRYFSMYFKLKIIAQINLKY